MTILKDIYKSFSGRDYEAVWRQFSAENNGTYIIGKYDKLDSVEIIYLNHKIIFDRYIRYHVVGGHSHDTEFTRIQLEFITPDDLRFRITKKGFIDLIACFFGAQVIQVGDKSFDKKFIIKGNDEYKIQTIFSNPIMKDLLLMQEDIQLQIIDKKGVFDELIQEGNVLLYYISETLVKDKEQLNSLLNLYQTLVDQLTRTSSMKPKKPAANSAHQKSQTL
jgi:hypothetical protein